MPKLPSLDGLRASAILIVILSHTGLGKVIPGGFGVTIFFFLSGYLITTLLRLEAAATGRINLRRFYMKRTLRILPPMYLTIGVVAGLTATGVIARDISPAGIGADLAFLTNYASQLGLSGGVAIPLWSLDVEEHFYILFSTLFALVLSRLASRQAGVICFGLAIAMLTVRLAIAWRGNDLTDIFYWSHTRIDSILWGSVLALWQNPVTDPDAWRPKWWQFGGALAVLVVCLAVRNPVFRETLRYSFQGAALFVVFSYALQDGGHLKTLLGSAPLRLVALLSYTLYLAHMPAIAMAEQWHLPVPAATGIAVAFAYAVAMYLLVERPLARWRRGI